MENGNFTLSSCRCKYRFLTECFHFHLNICGCLRQRHYFSNKDPSSKGYGFSSSHVWMWELDYKESWAQKNWCFWTMVLEKTLESPLDCKEINPKGNQLWIFIGRTDAEAEALIVWSPDTKSRLTEKPTRWKRPKKIGKDQGQRKRATEDDTVGWHHWLMGHEFEQTLGDSEGQRILACCSPQGNKQSGMTERLNNNYKAFVGFIYFCLTPDVLIILLKFHLFTFKSVLLLELILV